MTPDERYKLDPYFHMLVDLLEKHIESAQLTPSEIREAAILATIHYEMRTMRQFLIPRDCPDALLPDGEICPRCGGKRAPSGVGGGSWVHVR